MLNLQMKAYAGAESDNVRLTHKRQYKLLQMKEKEGIVGAFFIRVVTLMNQMKKHCYSITSQFVVEKIMRPLFITAFWHILYGFVL